MTVTASPTRLRDVAAAFLAQPRIAVAGVSRDPKQPANLIFRRLRDAGHEVFAVNPNATTVEDGVRAYAHLGDIAEPLDGVVIVTPPDAAMAVVEECAQAGVQRVWFHRGVGPGSASGAAIARARELGLDVIPGGCPCMFGETADTGHKVMCRVLQLTGKVPRRV
jgi:predicted CoA-binding protein